MNADPRDARWRRLRANLPEGPIEANDPPIVTDGHAVRRVVLGHQAVIAGGFALTEWWRTSRVRRVRELSDAEVENLSTLRG